VERRADRFFDDKEGLWTDPDPPQFATMTYMPELPTWISNFTSHRVDWILEPSQNLFRNESKPVFDASGGCPEIMPDTMSAWQTNILSVEGIESDRIAAFHPDSPISFPAYTTKSSPICSVFWYWTIRGSPLFHAYYSPEARWIAFLRTMGAGSRCSGTDEMLSDGWVKYHGMTFFEGTLLAQQWRSAGLRGDQPANAKDWYSTPKPDTDPEYVPGIDFDKLCFFRVVRGVSGRIGLAPPYTKPRDRIVVVFGCSSPLLLEEASDRSGHFRIRGEAYMHGFMFGEPVTMRKQGQLTKRTYNLI
jgi:hypothetical protein